MSRGTATTPPPLAADRALPILLTALEDARDWWYCDELRLGGDQFKLKARAVRAAVEQAIVIGRQAMREKTCSS